MQEISNLRPRKPGNWFFLVSRVRLLEALSIISITSDYLILVYQLNFDIQDRIAASLKIREDSREQIIQTID